MSDDTRTYEPERLRERITLLRRLLHVALGIANDEALCEECVKSHIRSLLKAAFELCGPEPTEEVPEWNA
ncbi:MAG: hypothetical protein K6T30_08335 [Alicyclobacillus sp.]|nr:hypothetical protein [Alicyclobacillus sp.]